MKWIKQLIVIGIFGLLIVGAVSVSGFQNPARKKLIGKWDVAFEMSQTDLRGMGVTANPLVAATAQQLMKAIQTEMQVEFRDDDTVSLGVTTFGFLVGDSGTWKVAGRDGEQTKIAIRFEGEEAEREWSIRFLDDNSFQMESPKDSRFPVGKMVIFRRAPPDPA